MAPQPGRVQISFPRHAAALLDSLNRLRLEGKFCDVTVHVGGRVFPAHKSVLAAASPFFHDKLLLQDGGRLALPPAIDAAAFEGLLQLIYSGCLTVALEALPGHLLAASGLQMWHVVDRCSEILREAEGAAGRWGRRSAVARGVRGHEGSSSSSSRVSRGREGSSLSWAVDGGEGSMHDVEGPVHQLDGSLHVNHSQDGSLSSSSSRTIHGHDGSSCVTDGGGEGSSSSSSQTIRGGEGSVHGHDGSSCVNRGCEGSSHVIHAGDGASLPFSWTVRGGDGGSPWTTCGGAGSSRIARESEGPSSSTSWIICGHDGSSRVNHGGEGPSSSSWTSKNGDRTTHGKDGTVHDDDGTVHEGDGTVHGGAGTVRGGAGTVRGVDGPSSSSSWATSASSVATRPSGSELLQIHVATGTSPSSPFPPEPLLKAPDGEEILKICVEDDEDDEEEDDEGPAGTDALRIVLEDTDATAPRDPPKIFYIKQELANDAAGAAPALLVPPLPFPTAPNPSQGALLCPQPSWKPVDLHGNEISGRAGALHAPVKLGAAPADGKRFGCACGKRFAVKPKRDRHIMLTLSLRPFACATCHKRFKLKHHLTEHMKTHDGARGACQGCGRRFRLRSGLAKHRALCPAGWGGCWACE